MHTGVHRFMWKRFIQGSQTLPRVWRELKHAFWIWRHSWQLGILTSAHRATCAGVRDGRAIPGSACWGDVPQLKFLENFSRCQHLGFLVQSFLLCSSRTSMRRACQTQILEALRPTAVRHTCRQASYWQKIFRPQTLSMARLTDRLLLGLRHCKWLLLKP